MRFNDNVKIFECKVIRCILIIIEFFFQVFIQHFSSSLLPSCDTKCGDTEYWWVQEPINEVYNQIHLCSVSVFALSLTLHPIACKKWYTECDMRKTLTDAQWGYIAIELRPLGVAWAMEIFHFLYVSHFILETSQKPLEAISSKSINQANLDYKESWSRHSHTTLLCNK